MDDREQARALVREAKRLRREATWLAGPEATERIIEAKRMEWSACELFLAHAEEWLGNVKTDPRGGQQPSGSKPKGTE